MKAIEGERGSNSNRMGAVLPGTQTGLGRVMRCESKSLLISNDPATFQSLYTCSGRYRATRRLRLQTKLGENVGRSPVAFRLYDIEMLSWSWMVAGSSDGKFNAKDLTTRIVLGHTYMYNNHLTIKNKDHTTDIAVRTVNALLGMGVVKAPIDDG